MIDQLLSNTHAGYRETLSRGSPGPLLHHTTLRRSLAKDIYDLYLHGIVREACTGNCTMGPIKQSSKRLSTIWVVALCMLTQDCNLSEEYRVEWPFFMFSKTTEITYQSSKYPPATSSSGDAHATNRGVPPSCDCWETGRGDSDCEVFDCTCICDLTAGKHSGSTLP